MTPFAQLSFEREIAAPVDTLWQAWLAPAARAIWSAPTPEVEVSILESDPRVGGREISICQGPNPPEIRVETGWLTLDPEARSVNYEVISAEGVPQSAALVTAVFSPTVTGSRIHVTVQLSSLASDMAAGYRHGFNGGLNNLRDVAERMMLIRRVINAPKAAVWGAWLDEASLPRWWGPEGFSCRTKRIDLRSGGEWVFDMIGPDGTVYPNHHRYQEIIPQDRLSYTLLWGENGPKHADAWARFDETAGATEVTLGMVFASAKECEAAKGFGAVELGLQTLGKLAKAVGAHQHSP
ncbi:SRPBCC family protein [Xinfangfangia sp. CPCC 101601]|uniref:SRPBCC family protein n=1 Tax=Pseudogemmobacter lacusdianii TaxID=3069608 RepID=A0ABU0W0N6_9RHOB|nr:SRPBCC family protein [Xinfangfangia sp. CPCC 101601]MDQ2067579.1 SRPBCC family protein [Xinfangfangia sp. CPCC 101601]